MLRKFLQKYAKLREENVAEFRKRLSSKDPKRPSRPPNAEKLFSMDKQPLIISKTPALNIKQVRAESKLLWRKASKKIQNNYKEKATRAIQEYAQRIRDYKPPSLKYFNQSLQNRPKRFLNAYVFFLMDHYDKVHKENPNLNFGQTSRFLACMWRRVKNVKKAPYLLRYMKDLKRWRNDMNKFVVQPVGLARPSRRPTYEKHTKVACKCLPRQRGSSKRSSSSSSQPAAKPKNVRSAYSFFVKKQFPVVKEQNRNMKPYQIWRVLACRWSKTSKRQKDMYFDKYKRDKKRWQREMDLYRRGLYYKPSEKQRSKKKGEKTKSHKDKK